MTESVEICGRHIPRNTFVGINLWVVSRYSNILPQPDSFETKQKIEDIKMN